MIASVIGKTFLDEYNRRQMTKYSAEEFFEKVFHRVFYDHEKYMQWVTNSPFVQGYKKATPPDIVERQKRLQTFKEKISVGTRPDASFAIGYPAADDLGTTSGQITNFEVPVPPDDIYTSWIGGGLGIGVQGGYALYFNNADILWKVYEGWAIYRDFLEERDTLRGNQIDTWNGQWFSYACSEEFDPNYPETGMIPAFEATKEGGLEIRTQQWTEILFGIASEFQIPRITGYVFSLGQTNTTVGFIPFELPELLMPLQFYKELFGENDFLNNKSKIQKMYGTEHSFRSACQKGAIGVEALEPKDLVQYMSPGSGAAKKIDYSKANDDRKMTFNVYQTWLLAMLNNKELWNRATEAAQAYLEYEAGGKKASTTRMNALKKALDSTSKRKFIEANTELVQSADISLNKISDLIEEINLLPEESFRYFLTLINFRYSFLKTQSKIQGES